MNAKDLNFAYQVKHALDQNLDNLPDSTAERLSSARKIALSRKKPEPLRRRIPSLALAGQIGNYFQEPLSWLGRLGVATPLLAGALVFIGLYQFEQEQRIAELAEMDVAVLSDELPVSAYVDQGFNAYLATRDE
ncbi:DUF3619 family protein [Noviherbaspirillum sedimenti]|uniref:DUF3619 family protein n=1 Tax=Noviherbaspirillum sedimenti TaxID=2320865 RepID=A0A3A3GIM0_9BURK|nr:DUF3619 family protein [Noviherbaspirillum sedimenti]RJG00770.1 DUF3619 family protein [Noviherbaspirillum sedimenti]